jgi:hypothetical protein
MSTQQLKEAIVGGASTGEDDIDNILTGNVLGFRGPNRNQLLHVEMEKQLTEYEDDTDRDEGPNHQIVYAWSYKKKTWTLIDCEPGLHHGYNERYRHLSSEMKAIPGNDDVYILRLVTSFGCTKYLINARKKTSEHLLHEWNMEPGQWEITISFRDSDVFE